MVLFLNHIFFALMFGFSNTRKYNINVNKINQDIIYYYIIINSV
nr:MAG TPA: hypothetical protein [Caudoviricetes sp.]